MFGKTARQLRRICTPCRKKAWAAYDKANPHLKQLRNDKHYKKQVQEAETAYELWLSKANVPLKPLSEAEWLEACRYFGGCAVCGSEHIEVRQFFVTPGQTDQISYSAINVFPTCGTCATHTRKVANPFKWLDKELGTAIKLGMNDERRQRMVDYFTLQIEKVVNDERES